MRFSTQQSPSSNVKVRPRRLVAWTAALVALPTLASAFCGFYVAKADAALFNDASQVVIARDGDRTVLTMANDYQGSPRDFAMVVPVPVVLKKDQIHVGEQRFIDRVDAFTSPRLVEYHDADPCAIAYPSSVMFDGGGPRMAAKSESAERARALGVTIEATYTVGEYDILILSAEQSDGLETWLTENGYRLPQGAERALAPYIKQGLKFFVAKVNLENQAKTGLTNLRPLQMAFEAKRFMLPIRLGMLNARGPQDLLVYTLTRRGRVETTNYRTVKIPTDEEIPSFVRDDFGRFYKDMFTMTWKREGRKAVVMEHFWDMSWCDPCAADILTPEELRGLGVFWLDDASQAPGTVVTRLHVRYDDDHFPEDLTFQETADRQNFQGRYVMRNAWKGRLSCDAEQYHKMLRDRWTQQAQTLTRLTGWPESDFMGRMERRPSDPTVEAGEQSWWQRIWKE